MVIGEEVTMERSLLVLMMMAAVEPDDGSPQDDAAEVLHSSARQMVRATDDEGARKGERDDFTF